MEETLPSTVTLDATSAPFTVTETSTKSSPLFKKVTSISPPSPIAKAPLGELPVSKGVGSGSITDTNGDRYSPLIGLDPLAGASPSSEGRLQATAMLSPPPPSLVKISMK